MKARLLEISEKESSIHGGRREFKAVLLTIHNDIKETNENGIHWERKYVEAHMQSVIGMGFFASFCDDDKRIPVDHGLTEVREINEKPTAIFENSECVGTFTNAYITDMMLDGKMQTVLVGEGNVYYQRYPNFADYLRDAVITEGIKGSIEIIGLDENDNTIIYAEENPTEEYRTPMEFEFSGYVPLTVQEGDRNAYILEAAQKNNAEDTNQNKEEINMDFEAIKQLIETTISSVLDTSADLNARIAELDQIINSKDEEIATLTSQVDELNEKLSTYTGTITELEQNMEPLQTELNEIKGQQAIAEMESALADFSNEQKEYASVEIESFKNDPLNGDVEAIKTKIYAGIGAKKISDDKADAEAKVAEINAKKADEDKLDIFGVIIDDTIDVEEIL